MISAALAAAVSASFLLAALYLGAQALGRAMARRRAREAFIARTAEVYNVEPRRPRESLEAFQARVADDILSQAFRQRRVEIFPPPMDPWAAGRALGDDREVES